jgi:hypothetical protein
MRRKYILTDLAGGLGNQIFLLEMSRFLHSLIDGKVYLNKHHIDLTHSNGKSTIENFLMPTGIQFVDYGKFYAWILNRTKRYLKYLNLIPQNLILILDDSDSRLCKKRIIDLVENKKPKLTFIFGFWQNFDFWIESSNYFLKNRSSKFIELERDLVKTDPIIFHYRLGQSNDLWESGWGALSPQFLQTSLEHLRVNCGLKLGPVWVFSNDLFHARNLILTKFVDSNHDLRFIDDSELTPAEVFMLFSKSNHLICSNSTMSISAAKISKAQNIIIPKVLSIKGDFIKSTPEGWIKIDPIWLSYT